MSNQIIQQQEGCINLLNSIKDHNLDSADSSTVDSENGLVLNAFTMAGIPDNIYATPIEVRFYNPTQEGRRRELSMIVEDLMREGLEADSTRDGVIVLTDNLKANLSNLTSNKPLDLDSILKRISRLNNGKNYDIGKTEKIDFNSPVVLSALRHRLGLTIESSGFVRPGKSGMFVRIEDIVGALSKSRSSDLEDEEGSEKSALSWCRGYELHIKNFSGQYALVVDPRSYLMRPLDSKQILLIEDLLNDLKSADQKIKNRAIRQLKEYRLLFGNFSTVSIEKILEGTADKIDYASGTTVFQHYRNVVKHMHVKPSDRVLDVFVRYRGERLLVPVSSVTRVARAGKGETAEKDDPNKRAEKSLEFVLGFDQAEDNSQSPHPKNPNIIKLKPFRFLGKECKISQGFSRAESFYKLDIVDDRIMMEIGNSKILPAEASTDGELSAFKSLTSHGPYNNAYDLGYVVVLPDLSRSKYTADNLLTAIRFIESTYNNLKLGELNLKQNGIIISAERGEEAYRQACKQAKAMMRDSDIAFLILPADRDSDFYYDVKDIFMSGKKQLATQALGQFTMIKMFGALRSLSYLQGKIPGMDDLYLKKEQVLSWFQSGLSKEHFLRLVERAKIDSSKKDPSKGLEFFLIEGDLSDALIKEKTEYLQRNLETDEVQNLALMIIRKNNGLIHKTGLVPLAQNIASTSYLKGGKYAQALWVLNSPADSQISGITPGSTCYVQYRVANIEEDKTKAHVYVQLVDATGQMYVSEAMQTPSELTRNTFYKLVKDILASISSKRKDINFALDFAGKKTIPELERLVFYQEGPMPAKQISGIKALEYAGIGAEKNIQDLCLEYGFNNGLIIDLVSITNRAGTKLRMYSCESGAYSNPEPGTIASNDSDCLFVVNPPRDGTAVPLELKLELHLCIGRETSAPGLRALASEYRNLVYLTPNPVPGNKTILDRIGTAYASYLGHGVDMDGLRKTDLLL